MKMHTRPGTIFTASLAVLLAFAFSNAASAKPKKFKTPSSEMGIKRDIDGTPNIRVDNRARHMTKPSRKRSTAQ